MPQSNHVLQGRFWVVVPVFNNKDTVKSVVAGCRSIAKHVLVVDDGSTDVDLTSLLAGLDVVLLKHGKNLGKGEAILTASRFIEERGGTNMITIDADGHHEPRDLAQIFPL